VILPQSIDSNEFISDYDSTDLVTCRSALLPAKPPQPATIFMAVALKWFGVIK
jgi:hypothetical protein